MKTIGRIQFLGYLVCGVALALLTADLTFAIAPGLRLVIVHLAFCAVVIPAAINRLRDMRQPLLWAIVEAVPLFNILFNLLLLGESGRWPKESASGWNRVTWRTAVTLLCAFYAFGHLTNLSSGSRYPREPAAAGIDTRRIVPADTTAQQPASATQNFIESSQRTLLETRVQQAALQREIAELKEANEKLRALKTPVVSRMTPPSETAAPERQVQPLLWDDAFIAAYEASVRRVLPYYPGLNDESSPLFYTYIWFLEKATEERDPLLRNSECPPIFAKRAADWLSPEGSSDSVENRQHYQDLYNAAFKVILLKYNGMGSPNSNIQPGYYAQLKKAIREHDPILFLPDQLPEEMVSRYLKAFILEHPIDLLPNK